MSLTFVLLAIGAAGLVAACWAVAAGSRLGEAGYRRRQWQAGLGLGGLLAAIVLVQAGHDGRVVQRLTAPSVDGGWAAVAIDGRAVPERAYRISVEGGRVRGGRDGCNDWGFDAPEVPGGPRMIVSTAVGCPEGDPVREAYWALALGGGAAPELEEDGRMRLASGGHEGVFRRCRWVSEPLPPGTSGTGPRVCVPE
ncbi:MAG TPA: hypothetical protein VGB04_13200 [Allosphingosinicella sp.]|jgi:hypothetical protein